MNNSSVIEYRISKSNLEKAIKAAWDRKHTLIIYPEAMDLIQVGDFTNEDTCCLKNSYVLDTKGFSNFDDFNKYTKTLGGF